MPRLFVAIDLSDAVRQAARSVQHAARPILPRDVRFPPIENLHLTLHFLGEVEAAAVALVISILHQEARSLVPFSLTTTTVGMFPSTGRGKILWLGLKDEPGVLGDFVARLRASLGDFTQRPEDRPFRPHVTIGRSKLGRIRAQNLSDLAVQPANQRVEKIVLYESILGSGAPQYQKLAEVSLAAATPGLPEDVQGPGV